MLFGTKSVGSKAEKRAFFSNKINGSRGLEGSDPTGIHGHLISNYRIQEGLLLITSGPHADFSLHTHREEYRPDERGEYPYRGLEKFRTEQRFERSLCFGVRDEADFL
jgi:hypothetical protein